jgi:suppressor of G2 allele of SKP1
VFAKGLAKDAAQITFEPRSVSISLKLPTGSDYVYDLDSLSFEIVPSECTYKVMSTKVEIKLKKERQGIKWHVLEGDDAAVESISLASAAPPSYPTSSKKGATNWDALAKKVEDDKPEGANALFQMLYKDADEDTRRAMMKSFTESNGTVLSTNWKEVGAKKVEVARGSDD